MKLIQSLIKLANLGESLVGNSAVYDVWEAKVTASHKGVEFRTGQSLKDDCVYAIVGEYDLKKDSGRISK